MQLEQINTLAAFGAVWAVLAVAHNAADHVFGQSDHQAAHKGAPSPQEVKEGASPRRGWAANLAHVGAYHAVLTAVYLLVRLAVPLPLTGWGAAAALAWSMITHAILDRRWPVRLILRVTGSPRFAELRDGGLNGLYLADQALHALALLGSAVMVTLL